MNAVHALAKSGKQKAVRINGVKLTRNVDYSARPRLISNEAGADILSGWSFKTFFHFNIEISDEMCYD